MLLGAPKSTNRPGTVEVQPPAFTLFLGGLVTEMEDAAEPADVLGNPVAGDGHAGYLETMPAFGRVSRVRASHQNKT